MDDGEGLSEAPDDFARSEQIFSLLTEEVQAMEYTDNMYHTVLGRRTSENLLYPFQVFTAEGNEGSVH